jgi:hypothetical protein
METAARHRAERIAWGGAMFLEAVRPQAIHAGKAGRFMRIMIIEDCRKGEMP